MPAIRRLVRGVATVLAPAMALGVLLVASPAAAHETREVGPYTFTVGFGDEPAFAAQPNEAEVTIREDGDPVVDGVDLEVEIGFGEATTTLVVGPNFVVDAFGEPGSYGATFVPTRPGRYAFRFFGTVGDEEVDETFTSGPETFSDANDPAEMAFPEADPALHEVAGRVEAESARLAEAAAAAEDRAGTATLVAVLALLVAALALAGAAVAVLRGRRAPAG